MEVDLIAKQALEKSHFPPDPRPNYRYFKPIRRYSIPMYSVRVTQDGICLTICNFDPRACTRETFSDSTLCHASAAGGAALSSERGLVLWRWISFLAILHITLYQIFRYFVLAFWCWFCKLNFTPFILISIMCILMKYEFCTTDSGLDPPKDHIERCKEWPQLVSESRKGDAAAKIRFRSHIEGRFPFTLFYWDIEEFCPQSGD